MKSWINQAQFRFRGVIFRSGFISPSRISSRLRLVSEFFYLKSCEESRKGCSYSRKNWEGFKAKYIRFHNFFCYFCFESGYSFEGSDNKEVGKGLCERGFWHDLFHGKDIDYNVMSLKIVYIVVSGLKLG